MHIILVKNMDHMAETILMETLDCYIVIGKIIILLSPWLQEQ
jgi:hypothetical protein